MPRWINRFPAFDTQAPVLTSDAGPIGGDGPTRAGSVTGIRTATGPERT
jgi:hypothetical protein